MEIIKQGKQSKTLIEKIFFICGLCGCEFKAIEDELKIECEKEILGESVFEKWTVKIDCPNCNTTCVRNFDNLRK